MPMPWSSREPSSGVRRQSVKPTDDRFVAWYQRTGSADAEKVVPVEYPGSTSETDDGISPVVNENECGPSG